MIGLDTSVLVRYIMRDDPVQTELATRLVDSLDESEQGFVSVIALVETAWVMTRLYHIPRNGIIDAIRRLLGAAEILLEREHTVRRALARMSEGADLSDALIAELGSHAGCRETVTFDRRASARAGMQLLTG